MPRIVFLATLSLLVSPAIAQETQSIGNAPQEPAEPFVYSQDPHQNAAYRALEELALKHPGRMTRTHDEKVEYFSALRASYVEFIKEWEGTAAALQTIYSMAELDRTILARRPEAAASMERVVAGMQAWEGELPSAFPIDLWQAKMSWAAALIDNEEFDAARAVLKPMSESDDPRRAPAAGMMARADLLETTATGMPFPEIATTNLKGEPFDWKKYQGRVLLLDFWSTFSGLSIGEMPVVVALHHKYQDRGFDIVGVNLDRQEAAEHVAEVVERYHMDWEHVFDGGGSQAALAHHFVVSLPPANILVDVNGVIRFKNIRGKKLDEAVGFLVEEAEFLAGEGGE